MNDTVTNSVVGAFIADAREKFKGGLTWAEFRELRADLVRTTVKILDAIPDVPGKSKKDYVMSAVGWLFDTLADRLVPWFLLPVWYGIRAGIRAWVMNYTSDQIETILKEVRQA